MLLFLDLSGRGSWQAGYLGSPKEQNGRPTGDQPTLVKAAPGLVFHGHFSSTHAFPFKHRLSDAFLF